MSYNKNWSDFINEIDLDTSQIKINDELHPSLWKMEELDPKIGFRLVTIAYDLLEELGIKDAMADIILTGSIATYNWHEKSDIDLHLLMDFGKIDDNVALVKKYLDSKRALWNEKHDIMVVGHEVEIYFQDVKEEHHANGVFSLLNDQWLKQPTKDEQKLDIEQAKTKAHGIAGDIEEMESLYFQEKYSRSFVLAEKIRKKLKKLRQTGLDREGINSPENLAFKILRNSEFIEKLHGLRSKSYDKKMSIDKNLPVDLNVSENWWKFARNRN